MGSYTGKSLDLSSYTGIGNIYIDGSGQNNIFIFGNNKTIVRGNITPNDITTFSQDQILDTSVFNTGDGRTGFYNNDGTVFFLISGGPTGGYEIVQLSGGSSYSIGNTEDSNYPYSADTGARVYQNGFFNIDGTAIIVIAFNRLRTYPLSTPYDLSTIGSQTVLTTTSIPNTPVTSVTTFSVDNVNYNKIYLYDLTTRKAYEHEIDTDFDLSSITYNATTAKEVDTTTETSAVTSIAFDAYNNALYAFDVITDIVYQYNTSDVVTPPSGIGTSKASGDNFITLTWLNTLGAWEYWTFTSKHSYGYDIQDQGIIERDIFQDWDSGFINGQSEKEVLAKDVTPFTVVRSQALTKDQVNAISKIKTSIKVQVIEEGKFTTVIVDPGSFTYRTDKEKNILIEFTIRYPREQIQKL